MRVALFLFGLLCAGFGYAAHEFLNAQQPPTYRTSFPDAVHDAPREAFCAAVAEGLVFENRSDLSANAKSARGTNKLVLKIAQDSTTASITYAADMEIGVSKEIPLTILSNDSGHLLAWAERSLGITAVIVDMRTHKAVVSYTGRGLLGMKASSLLMQCR